MRKSIILLASVLGLMLNTACSDEGKEGSVVPQPDEPTTVEKMALSNDQLSDMQTKFAFGMFKAASSELSEDNLFISPQSASVMLSMLANDEDEGIQDGIKELMTAIGFDGDVYDIESLNSCNQALIRQLTEAAKSAKFTIQNSVWSNAFAPDLSATLQEYYNAHCEEVNLTKVDGITKANQWVSKSTDGMIPKVFEAPLYNGGRAYISTLLLKADWDRQFNPEFTATNKFDNIDGSKSDVEYMTGEMNEGGVSFMYNADDDCVMVNLGLDGNRFYADFILPEEGNDINAFIDKFDAEKYNVLVNGLHKVGAGMVVIPKFEVGQMYELNPVFASLGMKQLFGGDNESCVYSRQFTHIAINEKGIDAAAASIAEINYGAGNNMRTNTFFTRPFIYVIREAKTGAILFMGKVTKL